MRHFRKICLVALVVLGACSKPLPTEPTPQAPANISMAKFGGSSPQHPEPAGGCPLVHQVGACISKQQTSKFRCVADSNKCSINETYDENIKQCHVSKSCSFEPILNLTEGDVSVLIVQAPETGGNYKDVKTPAPACDPSSKDASRCEWECIDAPQGRTIKTASFTAKEMDGDISGWDPHDANAHGWGNCKSGQDCDIGWSRWTAIEQNERYVCGRFMNWSHNRKRLAKLQATFGRP